MGWLSNELLYPPGVLVGGVWLETGVARRSLSGVRSSAGASSAYVGCLGCRMYARAPSTMGGSAGRRIGPQALRLAGSVDEPDEEMVEDEEEAPGQLGYVLPLRCQALMD